MAHFAKLGINSQVLTVEVVDNDKLLNADGVEDETIGQQHLQRIHGWPEQMWIQTSCNTKEGKYYNADGTLGDQSKAFRGNYAGIGFTWDSQNEIFIKAKPEDYTSWTKDVATASWVAPISKPTIISEGEGDSLIRYFISWNESLYQSDNTRGWQMMKESDDTNTIYNWNGTAWV